jgi:polyphosphate kinase
MKPTPETVVEAPVPGEEDHPFINREISWLAFNGRVLQEAKDPRVPLLERLEFLAIFSSNLDEFFRVRVASLRSLLRLKKAKRKKLGFRPSRLLREIHRIVHLQQEAFGNILRGEILPGLGEKGIFLLDDQTLSDPQIEHLRREFEGRLREHLEPSILAEGEPPPFLTEGQIYLVAELWPALERSMAWERPEYGMVVVPSPPLPRFLLLPGEGVNVLFLDDAIRLFLGDIFPGYEVGSAFAGKLSRDAELYLEEEFEGDLMQRIRKSLKKRETGLPSRFLYDLQAPYALIAFLKNHLGLEDEDLFPGGRYHNLQDLFKFPEPKDTEGLRRSPLPPLPHPDLAGVPSLFEALARKDRILHYPYQSMEYVLHFLEEAARDPSVDRIWITLYRVATDSRVVKALIQAAERGARVVAFVEVKARFDEARNLDWAQAMARAGVKILYDLPGLKVHAKLALISRIEGGTPRLYAYLATGNFNEKTAAVYCDHGLLTADERLTEEVKEVFRYLEGEVHEPRCTHLLVAPFTLRKGLTDLLAAEALAARERAPSGVVLKMNSLADEGMMYALREMGRAGVPGSLIVRGICRLPLGADPETNSLRGRSIVDRFLEHARIYRFVNRGDSLLFLSSADLMKRNLDHRVEVAFPILDPDVREELEHSLHLQLSDNTKARVLDRSQKNHYVGRRAGEPRVEAQAGFYYWLEGRLEP